MKEDTYNYKGLLNSDSFIKRLIGFILYSILANILLYVVLFVVFFFIFLIVPIN